MSELRGFAIFRAWLGFAALCAAVGCSGGASTVLTPQPHRVPTPTPGHTAMATSTATPTATPSSTPSPGATSSAAISAANAALTNVQTQYAALPHASLSVDLATLASEMVSSGQFKTAVVSPGGISATLSDGAPALVFADHVGDTSNASTAQRIVAPPRFDAERHRDAAYSGANETVAILVNNSDKGGAFNPVNQAVITDAVTAAGFSNSQYGVDNGNAGLDSVAGASVGGFVDYFDLATHGMVAVDLSGNSYYAWLSDTLITGTALSKYAADYAAGSVAYAVSLPDGTIDDAPTFAFTPQFVANHVDFSPGAIFVNESCFGQNSAISAQVGATLKAAGVGRYFGWTEPVDGVAADQTDAFIWDRLLGEINKTLGQFITQRSPLQRAFPLDDVDGILKSETRSGPFGTSSLTYAQSPIVAQYSQAKLEISDFGGESVAAPVVEYDIPSISYVAVTEDPANPTLTIYGKFPPQMGSAAIIDPSQTTAKTIAPTTWATDHVVIPIPVTGLGSKGNVVVLSQYGIQSNPVPLTQWSGTLMTTQNATWTQMGSASGTGSGTVTAAFTIDFRSDVHPTVPSIDASPVPQNLTFAATEGDSTAQVTSVAGSFVSGDGMHSAALGLGPTMPLAVGMPPLANTFYVAARPPSPATCNNSMPGPQTGPTNVFCPGIAFLADRIGTCTDDAGTLCGSATWNVGGALGLTLAAPDGLLVFTMDPASYAISVSSTSPNLSPFNSFEASTTITGSVTGTINAAVSPPTGKNPSQQHRSVASR